MKLCSIEQYLANIGKFKNEGKTTEEATALAYQILRKNCEVPSDVGRLSPVELVEYAENREKKALQINEQYDNLEKLRDKDKWMVDDINLVLDAIGDGEETRVRLLFPDTDWREILNAFREWNRGNSKPFLDLLTDYGYITEETLDDVYQNLQSQLDFASLRKRQWKMEDVKQMVEAWRSDKKRDVLMLFPGLEESDLNYAIGIWERDANPLIGILAGYGYIQSKQALGEALSRGGNLDIDLKYGHLLRCGNPFRNPVSGGLPDASSLLFEQDEPVEKVNDVSIIFSSDLSEIQIEQWKSEIVGMMGTYIRGEEPFVAMSTEDGKFEVTFKVSDLLSKDVETWERFRDWVSNKYLNGYILDVLKNGESTMEDWFGVEPREETNKDKTESIYEMMNKLNEILEV